MPLNSNPSTIQSNHRKTAHALNQNATAFVDHHGLNHCGFLTLTFKNRLWPIPAAKCLAKAIRFFPDYFDDWIWTMGLGNNFRIHYHALLQCRFDLHAGIDLTAYQRMRDVNDGISGPGEHPDASPADRLRNLRCQLCNADLRRLRGELYPRLRKVGFGQQINLSPILSSGPAVASYLRENYLETVRGRNASFSGQRLTGYKRGGYRVLSLPFAWTSQSQRRLAYRTIGEVLGVTDYEGMKENFGPKWGYLANLLIHDLESHYGENPRRWPQSEIVRLAEDRMPRLIPANESPHDADVTAAVLPVAA